MRLLLLPSCVIALSATTALSGFAPQPGRALRASPSAPCMMAWATEAAALELPMEPQPENDAEDAVRIVCTGLEFNNYPVFDAGVTRLFNYLTPQGRVKLAPPPPKKGTQSGVTLEYFLDKAGGPALGALLACSGTTLAGKTRLMPAGNAHGALATVTVEVLNLPEDLTITDALDRPAVCAEILRAARAGEPVPNMAVTDSAPPVRSRYVISLEQQRRPPHLGCWLIKEMYSLQKTELQKYADGGEEFEGKDSDD